LIQCTGNRRTGHTIRPLSVGAPGPRRYIRCAGIEVRLTGRIGDVRIVGWWCRWSVVVIVFLVTLCGEPDTEVAIEIRHQCPRHQDLSLRVIGRRHHARALAAERLLGNLTLLGWH